MLLLLLTKVAIILRPRNNNKGVQRHSPTNKQQQLSPAILAFRTSSSSRPFFLFSWSWSVPFYCPSLVPTSPMKHDIKRSININELIFAHVNDITLTTTAEQMADIMLNSVKWVHTRLIYFACLCVSGIASKFNNLHGNKLCNPAKRCRLHKTEIRARTRFQFLYQYVNVKWVFRQLISFLAFC